MRPLTSSTSSRSSHPADLAEVLSGLSDAGRLSTFDTLIVQNSRLAMEALTELDAEIGDALLAERPPEELAKLFLELATDDAAALIDRLPDELSAEVLARMRRKDSGDVQHLLGYGEQTAGRIMNPEVFALAEDLTAGEAIEGAAALARGGDGLLSLRRRRAAPPGRGGVAAAACCWCPPETPLKRIMTSELVKARVDTDQEEVAQEVANYNLLAIPVVDDENKLVGIITVDDVIDVIKDEATEDILRLAGVPGRRARVHVAPGRRGASGCPGSA